MNKSKALIVLSIVVVATLISGFLISRLRFDYDFEAFFPHEDPETEFYLEFRKNFETDNDFFIVALDNNEGVFQKEFLKKVDSLTSLLGNVEYLVEVNSPTRLTEYTRDPFMGTVFSRPMLRWDEPENYAIDSASVFQKPGMVGVFYSNDGKSLAINMKHEQKLSKDKCDKLSLDIEALVNSFGFDKAHVIGRALGQRVYVEMMIKELTLFVSLSLAITILFLFIAFRSGWGIIIPTLVVLISIIWTLGIMNLVGKNIDIMLTILPTIIFVVGMSDSVHVLTKYLQELRNGREKHEAIRYAFKSIRLATFLTALTTSIGFLTLVLSDIKPVSDFGVYTSLGVMLAYGLTFTMLPAILFLATPKRMIQYSENEDFWTLKLHRAFAWVLRKRKAVFIGGLVSAAIGLFGISLLDVDNVMLEDLRDDHFLKQEFRYMEEKFSGVRPFEMAIQLDEKTMPFDRDFLVKLDSVENYLEKEYRVGNIMSIARLIKSINKELNGGSEEYFIIPEQNEINQIKKMLRREEAKRIADLFINQENKVLRVSGKVGDIGRLHYEEENRKLDSYIAENKLSNHFTYRVTGTAHLIDVNNRKLVDNMVLDLFLSVVVIGIIMAFIYKSWRMFFLTIIPNIIPLVLVGGIMGYLGIPIKISTSIVFNIAFGIAVDDTIHFLARVKTLLSEGLSLRYAVKRTFLTTGKAMIVTTLILCGGFMTLIFSNFLGTFYIGLLITLTLIIGVITELLFAPLVVLFFFKKKEELSVTK